LGVSLPQREAVVSAEPAPETQSALLFEVPHPLPPLEAVRGTIFILDWLALREQHLFDDYERHLGKGHALFAATAFDWVPLPLVINHYHALEACHPSPAAAREVGRFVGDQVHGKFLGTLVRLAGRLGVSPWVALRQSYKLWTRSWKGGAPIVTRVSEAVARFEVAGVPFVDSTFFRNSFMGAVEVGIEPFCKVPAVTEIEADRSATSFAMRVGWH
jgi:hypothetical protein